MKLQFLYIVVTVLLYSAGGQLEIPLGTVPFILTDFFVFFAALRLKPLVFAISILIFLILGALGLPVFAGGAGGLQHLSGGTSGYLLGYLVGGLWVSLVKEKVKSDLKLLILVFSGYYILFILGIMGLVLRADLSFEKAIESGFKPFMLSMHLKSLLAWGLSLLIERFYHMR